MAKRGVPVVLNGVVTAS